MAKERQNYIKVARRRLLSGISVPEAKPFTPDSFQLEAIESLKQEHDTLVVAPTGTGKTFIATEGIRNAVQRGKRAVYTAPLKALSNTKYGEFKALFEPEFRVGLLTGDRKIDGDAEIIVATTEIYRNELFRGHGNFSLVVLDEFHYIADAQRGPVWEESVILSPHSASILMLSASISNAEEIADWIQSVRKQEVTIIRETERPVELRVAVLHPDHGVLPLDDSHASIRHEIDRIYQSNRRHFSPNRGGFPPTHGKGRKGGRNSGRKNPPKGKGRVRRGRSK